jgi:hypothetical protein
MWTDERLDERFNSIDRRFDILERRMEDGFARVDRDIRDLRVLMFQLWGSTMVAILGTLATVLATNV